MEFKYVPLTHFDLEPTLDDKFWLEKVKRMVKETDDRETLKEVAVMLAEIATKRQGVVRGLIKDLHEFMAVNVTGAEMDNIVGEKLP